MDKKPQKKAATPAKTTESSDTNELDNVDKIRDILFGNQMRDFDRKFHQLEERISSELDSLRKESALQMES